MNIPSISAALTPKKPTATADLGCGKPRFQGAGASVFQSTAGKKEFEPFAFKKPGARLNTLG